MLRLPIQHIVELSISIVSADNAFVQSSGNLPLGSVGLIRDLSSGLDTPQRELGLPGVHILLEVLQDIDTLNKNSRPIQS